MQTQPTSTIPQPNTQASGTKSIFEDLIQQIVRKLLYAFVEHVLQNHSLFERWQKKVGERLEKNNLKLDKQNLNPRFKFFLAAKPITKQQIYLLFFIDYSRLDGIHHFSGIVHEAMMKDNQPLIEECTAMMKALAEMLIEKGTDYIDNFINGVTKQEREKLMATDPTKFIPQKLVCKRMNSQNKHYFKNYVESQLDFLKQPEYYSAYHDPVTGVMKKEGKVKKNDLEGKQYSQSILGIISFWLIALIESRKATKPDSTPLTWKDCDEFMLIITSDIIQSEHILYLLFVDNIAKDNNPKIHLPKYLKKYYYEPSDSQTQKQTREKLRKCKALLRYLLQKYPIDDEVKMTFLGFADLTQAQKKNFIQKFQKVQEKVKDKEYLTQYFVEQSFKDKIPLIKKRLQSDREILKTTVQQKLKSKVEEENKITKKLKQKFRPWKQSQKKTVEERIQLLERLNLVLAIIAQNIPAKVELQEGQLIVRNTYAPQQVQGINIPKPQNQNESPEKMEKNQTTEKSSDDLLSTQHIAGYDTICRHVDRGIYPDRCGCCKARLKDNFSQIQIQNLLRSDVSIDESKPNPLFNGYGQNQEQDCLQLQDLFDEFQQPNNNFQKQLPFLDPIEQFYPWARQSYVHEPQPEVCEPWSEVYKPQPEACEPQPQVCEPQPHATLKRTSPHPQSIQLMQKNQRGCKKANPANQKADLDKAIKNQNGSKKTKLDTIADLDSRKSKNNKK